MPQISGIYDSAYIQPVAKIKEYLGIRTGGRYKYYLIDDNEPIPPGPASTVDAVANAGLTNIPAGGTSNKALVQILQLASTELLHLRFCALDPLEGVIWEQPGQAKFNTRFIHARVDQWTPLLDPQFATTTFFIIGLNRDMNLEVRNPGPSRFL